MKQKLINWYLGGVPDPSWQPLFTFPWGAMALPGERGRHQHAQFEMEQHMRWLKTLEHWEND